MFGLSFILNTYTMSNSELAQRMDINRANISMWVKNRAIPSGKLNKLCEIFPKIPQEYFQKELTKSETIKIQEIYFTETDVFEEIEVPFIDDDGIEHMTTQTYSEHQGIIYHLRDEFEKQSLLERHERLINEDNTYGNEKMLDKYIELLEVNDRRHIELLKMVFHFLKDEKEFAFGYDPFFAASQKEVEMYEDFGKFLKKYGVID